MYNIIQNLIRDLTDSKAKNQIPFKFLWKLHQIMSKNKRSRFSPNEDNLFSIAICVHYI